MGNILSLSLEQMEDPHSAPELRITIDFQKPVRTEVKQLLHWSLSEIRTIYAPFRKRKGSPLLTRSQFLRFLRLSRISAFHIYDCLCQQAQINAFEVMAILILTAYTTYSYKIQFLVIVFDLLSQRTLKFSDLILMFKSVVRGFALLTQQPLPDIHLLEKYAQTVFMRADLNNDQNLQLAQILAWVEENKDALALFKSFEPKNHGKEEYHIFNLFAPYSEGQVDLLLGRIRKIHYREKTQPEDYQPLRKDLATGFKENLFRVREVSGNKVRDASAKHLEGPNSAVLRSPSRPLLQKSNTMKLPLCTSSIFQSSNPSTSCWGNSTGGKFSNIIIIKGRTITKKDVFDLRDYYEKLSGGKQSISIQDFIDSFSQEKYNHMKSVAASLYNFLDQDQNGKVSFKELLLKIYPNLTSLHLTVVDRWCEQYATNFNFRQRSRPNRGQEDSKKRVLPKTCLTRFRQMFSFYDKQHKGYIDLQDMQRVLCEVCSQNEIVQLFEDSDKDKDGKLTLQEFANVILPSDLEIEGL